MRNPEDIKYVWDEKNFNIIQLSRKYGYNVEIHHMIGEFKNEHGVPDWKIEEMKNKRQMFSLADFE